MKHYMVGTLQVNYVFTRAYLNILHAYALYVWHMNIQRVNRAEQTRCCSNSNEVILSLKFTNTYLAKRIGF